jgi:hypothetical protein
LDTTIGFEICEELWNPSRYSCTYKWILLLFVVLMTSKTQYAHYLVVLTFLSVWTALNSSSTGRVPTLSCARPTLPSI